MQALLEFLIKGLVDNPDGVRITPVEQAGMTVYELRLHPNDIGKVIGKQGNTIHTIRSLLQVGSAKKGIRCRLELIEDQEPSNPDRVAQR